MGGGTPSRNLRRLFNLTSYLCDLKIVLSGMIVVYLARIQIHLTIALTIRLDLIVASKNLRAHCCSARGRNILQTEDLFVLSSLIWNYQRSLI